jgi:hypothetical protein
VERWYAYIPNDAEMRIPDNLRDCTCFLFVVDNQGRKRYCGTGFFMQFYHEDRIQLFTYLVTAKHCVTKPFEVYGNLHVRLNMADGRSEEIELDRTWAYSTDEGVDVAVRPWQLEQGHKQGTIDFQSSAHDKNMKANAIGIGNELLAIGLFRLHHGTNQNIPIVRQGILSSMPEEPLVDKETGLEYKAYLGEIQSIGGLSGSPVFVYIPSLQFLAHHDDLESRDRARKNYPAGFLYLLGLIRGHFDSQLDDGLADLNAGDSVHTGIAIIVPIEEVISIVENDPELKRIRREAKDARLKSADRQTLDADIKTDEPFTKADFESALRKVSRKIEPEGKPE